ncbi:phospho-sugar mutase [Rhodococcus aerolatus]
MTGVDPALAAEVRGWVDADPDPATREELTALLRAGDAAALRDRFAGPLAFGTAGLRGPVRAGPSGMNVAVVTRTTAGLAAWLRARGAGGGVVVVGRDARHGSAAFATATAEVLAAAGFVVRLLPRPLPTPVLAYAVRAGDAVAGVQVTASHNPREDNGYKVYLAGGAQLVPPDDRGIEAAVAAVGPAAAVPRSPVDPVGEDVLGSYLDRVATLPRGTARGVRVALTAMHGVGGEVAREALARAGFDDVHVVAAQQEPDPDFPTVGFPNPEEPGAGDAVLALAEQVGADLAVALDPDADRCALGVRDAHGWRLLRGDETGVLLGAHVLAHTEVRDPLVATTIVSSQLLARVAAAAGARSAETLTGFKWLVRAGEGLVYAYEEAIGHCVDPDVVRDKDGISAAVLAADLVAWLAERGRTLLDELDDLAVRHGVHAGDQVSLRVTDLARIDARMLQLRADPPPELAGAPVALTDLLPRTDGVVLRSTADGPAGVRVVVRPSGTEPKLKHYLEVVEPVDGPGDLPRARAVAQERLDALRAWAAAGS